MYLWPKPDFQQVRQVKTKASNKEVDMLTDLEEDVSPCEHCAGLIWKKSCLSVRLSVQTKEFSHPENALSKNVRC